MHSVYASKKHILAPMVRAGRTPLRVLALSYGADLVYTEEIVDQRLLASQRFENAVLGTVDYMLGDEVVLRIADEERAHCVLQIGTNSPENAAKVCQKVRHDVAAIDLNMGCPKPFSVHCGMGAVLLSQPDRAKEILLAMVATAAVPVSCKIRLLNSREETLQFVHMVERCGVSALAVHGRRRDERPKDKCRVDEIRQICRALSIPVIANGHSDSILSAEDLARFREEAGASGVMLARRALAKPSIFRTGGILPMEKDIQNFLQKACQYDESFTGTKYVVQRILGSQQEFDPRGRRTVSASTVRQICRIWGIDNANSDNRRSWQSVELGQDEGEELDRIVSVDDNQTEDSGKAFVTMRNGCEGMKRARNDDDEDEDNGGELDQAEEEEGKEADGIGMQMVDDVLVARITFHPRRLKCGFNGKLTPKCVLKSHCVQQRLILPLYQTRKSGQDHRFSGTVCVNGRTFGSSVAQPNIKMAEQVASLVALYGLNIRHKLDGDWEER